MQAARLKEKSHLRLFICWKRPWKHRQSVLAGASRVFSNKNQLAKAEADALAASKAFDDGLDDDDWDDEDDDGVEVIYVRD